MKFLKYLLGLLVLLILIWVALNFIAPKDVEVSRSQEIKANKSIVFNLINDLENWKQWSPWLAQDTSMTMVMGDKTIGVGGNYKWISPNMGNGSMEIIASEESSSMKTKLLFEGWDTPSYGTWALEENAGKTKITWGMTGEGDIPWYQRGFMMLMGFKGTLESSFESGLKNIKEIAEQRAQGKYGSYQVKSTSVPEKHFVMTRAEINEKDITQFYARSLPSLYSSVTKSGTETNGMPCGLFFKTDEKNGKVDLGAAIPVNKPAIVKDAISFSTPSKKAVVVDYYGDYEKTNMAHTAIKSYLKDNAMLYDPPYIEEYVTDPGKETDPKKWLTRITYFIAAE